MITKSTLEDDLYDLLLEKKYETILVFLKTPENEPIIKEKVWTLINKMCSTIKTNKILEHESDFVLCKKILLHIVDHGNPREVIVALMEEADCFKEHSFFCLLLDPLKDTLKKIASRARSLEWILNSLNAHIETLPPPPNCNLEGEEKLLLDAMPEVLDANYILSNYFNFVDFFVDQVRMEEDAFQRQVLHEYLLKLFHRPFLYHDLHLADEAKPKSTTRILCEKYVGSLSKISRNIFDLYKYDRPKESEASPLAFSNLSYLLLVERLALDSQPCVYSHVHMFLENVNYMKHLLSETDNSALFKGVSLAEVLLSRLDDLEIPYVETSVELSRLLLNVAIHCQLKELRQRSVQVFISYIHRCEWKARYHYILQVICTVDHSGCAGLAIDLYKKFLHQSFDNPHSYFLGRNLAMFLKRIFFLCDGAATDLLENSDRIVATLNLLRYLILRDSREVNKTGIWNLVSGVVSETYVEPLLEAINLSRAHYKETARHDDKTNIVTVNDTAMPRLAWNGIREKALLTFDLLESLVSRVREIINL